uniref:Esterase n=1 Tax=Rhizophora mucronata TaxID=61149 RepID=A0A2P2ILL7_RHIMU
MAISSSHFSCEILLLVIFICYCSTFASDVKNRPNPGPFKKIYAFGDSFTDTGNTRSAKGPNGFGHVSKPPYGSTYFHHPTNRYSDGRLVIDFVAERLSLPYLPPYRYLKGNATYGVNFAVGGSTAINHAFFVKNNLSLDTTPESIQTQLIWFNMFLERQGCIGSVSSSPKCRETFDDALIWVGEIGVTDYAYAFTSTIPNEIIQKLAIGSVTAFLQVTISGNLNALLYGLKAINSRS